MSSISRSDEGWHMARARLSEYVMVAEAAEILGVSQGTIRTWAADGKIPMHKNPANGYRLFRRDDLEKFLAKVAKPEKPK
jgi:excisionase family DNA binding protein